QVPNDVIIMRGLDFERQGRFEDAVAAFRQVLAREPANVQALLGAERGYAQLGRRDSTLALATRAVAADPLGTTAWTVQVRSARALGGEAMAAEVLGRWMAAMPRSESPYRELVRSLITTGRLDDAREAVVSARTHLGDPERLHPELAAVEAAAGNWSRAAGEWRAAVKADNDLAGSASFNLMSAPAAQRERVIHALTDPDSAAVPRRVAAELLLGWNDPERAWATLQTAIPTEPAARRSVLQSFADRARAAEGRPSQRAAAQALEFLASGLPPAEAARIRIESARAFSAAGDQAAARRVLRGMADDPNTGAEIARSATTTLVELYAREGNAAEAARLLEQQRARLPGTEAARLGIIVARGWIAAGDLDKADAAILPDSSLAAEEVRGWTALYRGDLADARERLRAAGPTGRGPEAARNVERATMLALLQAVRADSSPALGAALFLAARGDTAQAAQALVTLARSSGIDGKPELLATAARYTAVGDTALAESLWTEVATTHPESAPAPMALLALARLQAARGDNAGAVQRLEALILHYPASALVPEARRELDRVRGALPPSS
ncbi:MAG: tetratricopeptide repeat protein, partial [Gemmatimonadales bacterium]